jgi:hypothetical protein
MKAGFATAGFLCVLLATARAGEPPASFAEVDYAKIDRRIAKEPRYNARPLYALFVFDPQGKFRVWAVLDKSKADAPRYDVLYFDRNGNGDLTEPGKRFTGSYDEKAKNLTIKVGTLAVPGTKLVHTDLKFCTGGGPHDYVGIYFIMKWDGKEPVEGGLRGFGTDQTVYAPSPRSAPVLRPTPLGPLGFVVFTDRELHVGRAEMVQVGVGSPGSGPDTFCALSEHFLDLTRDRLVVTLIAKDKGGKALRVSTDIKKHC